MGVLHDVFRQGMEQGREQGKDERSIEIAEKMVLSGESINKIKDLTELNENTIRGIMRDMNIDLD